ncbi:glutathione S-transferase [Hyphococcus flavus]|uniref:Glutathione S-transferase n=1 Tax=Hyphococcus flavus TaxID=1866326 RepID=A0AAF0CF92_9PROT|nr:glutathione S-transferase [Hyphococcus flavus]WDI31214.1 glutathione S-transferase [Hyphococcus flavus]
MTNLPMLYSFRRCPYAMRGRMAIAVSGTPVRLREILLRDKPEEMLEASPKGTVPVIVIGDQVIDESLDVMRWALEQNDPEGWLKTEDTEGLIEECDGPFKHHLDRYKYSTRYEGADAEEHRAEGLKFLQKLETQLADTGYLYGNARTLADIAIFPFVRQFRIADMEWFDAAPIPNVQHWLKTLMESELFASVMEKYPLWKETGEEFGFPNSPSSSRN